ncbi:tetrathionate reductase family octaheme c-type cytochrome [Thiohalocapsa halophila]
MPALRLPALAVLTLIWVSIWVGTAVMADVPIPVDPPTADHSEFDQLQGDFANGREVTRACLTCHTEAGEQVRSSIHWRWEYAHPDTGQLLGKQHVVNSFCNNVTTNLARCTACHVGYGWDGPDFDFSDDSRVDCLVCHDTTGTYEKAPKRAGRVLREPTRVHGNKLTPPNLGEVARNVGPTSKATCGGCHFFGGGGNGSKHGDLDTSLLDPKPELDVHMSPDGAGLTCSDCHVEAAHHIAGSRYQVNARDRKGRGAPGERRHAATCESCHGTDPHPYGDNPAAMYQARKLNGHADRVACQSCHIPAFARGGVATKTWWDWSKAGRLSEDGNRIKRHDEDGNLTYGTRFGAIRWGEDLTPTYRWFDGTMRFTLPDQTVDASEPVPINHFRGGPQDPDARIWPFKMMRGKQPYDPVNQRLVYMQLFGKSEEAYWTGLDWQPAIASAMAQAGLPFSGEVAFAETRMAWPITHMVAPADEALACGDCHAEDGRMAELTGVYLPGRDAAPGMERWGKLAVAAAVLGVAVHLVLRLWLNRRRRQQA